ncbi:MAG: hypothetical protein RL095_1851 [Verrucomicrobiota bacterium]
MTTRESALPEESSPFLLRAAIALAVIGVSFSWMRQTWSFVNEHRLDSSHLGEALSRIPASEWLWSAAHLGGALLTIPLALLLLSVASPFRALPALARAGNPAAVILLAAQIFAVSILAGSSWGGQDAASFAVAAGFTAIAVATLAITAALHRFLTRYDDAQEISDGNCAAALAAAGQSVAVAVLAAAALSGPFSGWTSSLKAYALSLIWIPLLWPCRQILLSRLILRGRAADLDAAVAQRRDLGVAAVEGLFYVALSLLIAGGF